jgi:hypothetical protein
MDLAEVLKPEQPPLAMWTNLSRIGQSPTLRCDAKQSEGRFLAFEKFISGVPHFVLGDFLPRPFAKGTQPQYLDETEASGVPVVSTLAIQGLSIDRGSCRLISEEEFEAIDVERKPNKGDVLLTMDGGTSIGKPALFDLTDEFAVDSHVAILRPEALPSLYLVYLLASPLGQIQFQQAESGASGQTAVTEEDVRRFRFPLLPAERVKAIAGEMYRKLSKIKSERQAIAAHESDAWAAFCNKISSP